MHYQNFNDKLEKAVLTFLDFWTQMEYRGIDPIATIIKLPDYITFDFKYCMQDFVYQYVANFPENNLSKSRDQVLHILYPSKTDQEIIDEFPKVVSILADLFDEIEYDLQTPSAALMRLSSKVVDDLAYFMSKYEEAI